MKRIFFFTLAFLMLHFSEAQQRCGHVEYMNYLYKKNPSLKRQHDSLNVELKRHRYSAKQFKSAKVAVTEVVYEIPVVVHVIYNNAAGAVTNIPDAQILSQIALLNKDYSRTNSDTNLTYNIYKNVAANVNIQFCLATTDPEGGATDGIVRVYNQKTSFDISDGPSLKGLSYWPSDQYLNLWVCNIVSPYLGFAQFPNYTGLPGLVPFDGPDNTDGVVIDYKAFGNTGASTYPYNGGRTTTHEVAHWLGLLHIWGDNFCGDDHIDDTPTQDGFNSGEFCDTSYSSCSGPPTIDMLQNYMDYTADICMNLFTLDQKDRMRAVMQISPNRAALLNSSGCCPPEIKVPIPQQVDFEDNSYLTDQWQVVNFDASSAYSKNWTQVSPGAYGQSNGAFMIENDSVYTSTDSTYWDVFQSPLMDLSRADKPMLDFDLSYARGTSLSETDSLVVYYNLGCKDVWTACKVFDGDELVSTTRLTDDFIPAIEEWKKVSVDLGVLSGKKRAKFRIAVFSKGINKLYIDNINFYKESNDFEILLYPVPAEEELNVEVIFSGYRDVKIEAFNALGKKLFERENNNTTSFVEKINVLDLGAGVYIFQVTAGGKKLTKRIIVY